MKKLIKETYDKTKSWATIAAGTVMAGGPWALVGLEDPPNWTPGAVMAGMAAGLATIFKGVSMEVKK